MKKVGLIRLVFCFAVFSISILVGCGGGGGGSSAPPASAAAETPIIFIHLSGGYMGGQTLYEYFVGSGFPAAKLYAAILPRVRNGSSGQSTATKQQYGSYGTYTDAYDRTVWTGAGNTADNVPYLKNFIDNVLTQTGAAKVDLIAHSNGTAVLRLLLQDAAYAAKIRKAVFVSGFADVNGTSGTTYTDWIYNYLNDVSLNLPSGIDYYALAGTADSYRNEVWTKPAYVSGIDMLLKTADVPGATNIELTGYDHFMMMTGLIPVQQIYTWLTGKAAGALTAKSVVTIGGTLVDTMTNDWQQTVVSGATVNIDYYDITTGAITQTNVCSTTTATDGKWSCSGLDATKNFKLSCTYSGKKINVYLADKITQDSMFLPISPLSFISYPTNTNGTIMTTVLSWSEDFYNANYHSKPATTLTGWISNNGGTTKITFDATKTVSSGILGSSMETFTNATLKPTSTAGAVYNLWQEVNSCVSTTIAPCDNPATSPTGNLSYFDGQTVTLEVTLNSSRTVRIQFSGNDAASSIYNWIAYVY
jgi:pimeloyl-ACP methyl ester carboxylesterase